MPSARNIQPVFLPGGGEMGERIRSVDWSKTPVGPIEGWPESLKTAVSICIGSRHPMVLWWGKSDLTQFYNDAYIYPSSALRSILDARRLRSRMLERNLAHHGADTGECFRER